MRTIKTGATDGTNTVVTSGLKPGDTIVVDGADRLRDGAEVSIPAAPSGKINAPSAAPSGEQPQGGGRGQWMERLMKRLPPEQQEMLKKMTPEQRRDWFRQHRDHYLPLMTP